MGRPRKNRTPAEPPAPLPPESQARRDQIERLCVRLELAWAKRPDMRLGELMCKAQMFTLAPQLDLHDESLVEAVESYAGLRL